jgi:hypothetical protein
VPHENCEGEKEPNDGKQDANALNPARCGTVSRDDKDFLQFRLKPQTKEMFLRFAGNVRLRVDVDGQETVELTPDSHPKVEFVRDADYTIEVTKYGDDGADADWRVEVVEH